MYIDIQLDASGKTISLRFPFGHSIKNVQTKWTPLWPFPVGGGCIKKIN